MPFVFLHYHSHLIFITIHVLRDWKRGLHRHWDSGIWNWTSLNTSRYTSNVKSTCWSAARQKLLTKEQVKICLQQPALMLSVWEAGQSGSQACRQAFADRRWNCSSVDFLPRKTPDLSRGWDAIFLSKLHFKNCDYCLLFVRYERAGLGVCTSFSRIDSCRCTRMFRRNVETMRLRHIPAPSPRWAVQMGRMWR